ncbi:hypothetical protein LOZ58_003498 [Ophidiomyces ophidiicola]|nr:hypothetical protein LOZ66_005080 [Ophidiomyces ophidiicola]KAI1961012.1 hypothetical protein LOZ58_003498 [Ophidiomyces ophidiicola]
MKFITLALLSSLSIASAWKLTLHATDGRESTMSGRDDVKCENVGVHPTLNVDRANFDPKTHHHRDPTKFELFSERDCEHFSYRNEAGDHKFSPRKIRSYRVL